MLAQYLILTRGSISSGILRTTCIKSLFPSNTARVLQKFFFLLSFAVVTVRMGVWGWAAYPQNILKPTDADLLAHIKCYSFSVQLGYIYITFK